jgi:regulator of protease activity HflC (stomatin/prohibitin superfamily)
VESIRAPPIQVHVFHALQYFLQKIDRDTPAILFALIIPGFKFVLWPVQTLNAVSLRTQQLEVHTNTKTKDNVTVKVTCAIQYQVDPNQVDTYYFKLYNPQQQIQAYVDDCVRAQLPTMTLDEAFVSTEQVAGHVKEVLAANLKQFGLIVVKALMTDMQPDATVMAAMNKINSARREREAAVEQAEGAKILAVRAAEAEAEAKHLSGMGTAKMRTAITSGFATSIESMKESCGLEPREVVHMMLVTQYLDVLKDFAHSGKATMVVPHGISAVADIEGQVCLYVIACRSVQECFCQGAVVNAHMRVMVALLCGKV